MGLRPVYISTAEFTIRLFSDKCEHMQLGLPGVTRLPGLLGHAIDM